MKNKIISYLFVLLWLVILAGLSYLVIMYMSDILQSVVNFVTSTGYSKLTQCGVTPPPEFDKVKADLITVIVPAFYLGPVALFVLSFLMFLSGYYYHKARLDDETKKHEEIERTMVHKLVQKMETEKSQTKKPMTSAPMSPLAPQTKKDEPEEDPEQAQDEDEEPQEEEEPEEEELPPPKSAKKKK